MSRHLNVRRQSVDTEFDHSVEFSDLLDPIRSTSAPAAPVTKTTLDPDMAFADLLVADLLVADMLVADRVADDDKPELEQAPELIDEPAVELVVVSRFADAGVDDDRLPVRAPGKRFRLR